MKRYAAFFLSLVAMLSPVYAADPPSVPTAAATFAIAGVVSTGNGVVASKMRVLLLAADGKMLREQWTDAEGSFHFEAPAGKFVLLAMPQEHFSEPYGESTEAEAEGYSTGVVTGSDLDTSHLDFHVNLPGAVQGTIEDEENEPAENVAVELLRSVVSKGQRKTLRVAQTTTNDLGQYRFGSLRPGRYFVLASGSPWYAGSVQGNQTAVAASSTDGEDKLPEIKQIAYRSLAYPADPLDASASGLPVESGSESRADLRLSVTSGVTVEVDLQIVTAAETSPCNGTVALYRAGEENEDAPRYTGSCNSGPNVDITDVLPGSYTLAFQGTISDKPMLARKRIEVRDSALRVFVKPMPLMSLSGQIVRQHCPAISGGSGYFVLQDREQNLQEFAAESDPSRFTIATIAPGTYTVAFGGRSQCFVAAVSQHNQESKGTKLDVGVTAPDSVKIVLSGDAGHVTGFLTKQGKADAGALVVLVPEDPKSGLEAAGYQTDSDGSFEFQTVPPGNYRIIASPFVGLEFARPEVLQPLLAGATRVLVSAGESKRINLEMPSTLRAGNSAAR